MALISPEELVNHPEYIQFLLSPDTPLDFHVNVGNVKGPDIEKLEQIKVVKWMLIARSKVLRVMLLESEMRPKKSFDISDINHNTFKNFLVFVYGHDNTTDLPFEDAVDLLSVAEKYDVADLKRKLGVVVKSQVSADNVLTILQYGPVCETVPDLWAKATDVIQTETQVVFGHPQFLTLRPEAVVHILQQEALSVEEIDVWRASLAWARHQLAGFGADPSPEHLRTTMAPLLAHTRLCTVPLMDLSEEVGPTKVLTAEEYRKLCGAIACIARGSQPDSSHVVSNEIHPREKKERAFERSMSLNIKQENTEISDFDFYESRFFILTKPGSKVVLKKFDFITNDCPWEMVPEGLTYQCEAKVTISKVTDFSDNTSTEPPREVTFNQQVPYDNYVEVPLSDIVLEANEKYSVNMHFIPAHKVLGDDQPCQPMRRSTDHLTFIAGRFHGWNFCGSHLKTLHYQT